MSKGEPPEFRLTRHDAYVETSYTIAAATCVPQPVRFGSLEAVDTSPSWHGGDNIFADCEIDGIWDENGSMFVTGAHHDGRACVEIRQLTDKGESLYSDFQMDGGFYLPEDGFETMGFVYREGDIEDVDLPAVIEENRDIVELVVSAEVAPYMDPDKLPGCEQSLDSLCNEKTDEAQSMRYGMEGVGLPMLDAAEHLANY